MKHQIADPWLLHARGATIIIPSNGILHDRPHAILLTKHARVAAQRYPALSQELGDLIHRSGHHSYYFQDARILTVPIAEGGHTHLDLALLTKGIKQSVRFAASFGLTALICPQWELSDPTHSWDSVTAILTTHWDDRFTLITEPPRNI